jgi:hypothetical protein
MKEMDDDTEKTMTRVGEKVGEGVLGGYPEGVVKKKRVPGDATEEEKELLRASERLMRGQYRDADPSMGCKVPHNPCPTCSESWKEHVEKCKERMYGSLNFYGAMSVLKYGSRVRRKVGRHVYPGLCVVLGDDGQTLRWAMIGGSEQELFSPSIEDIEAGDWEVVG